MINTTNTKDSTEQKEKQMAIQLPVDLRDYFAAKAMQGLLANGWCAEQREIAPNMGEREIALDAYRLADAMMKAREA